MTRSILCGLLGLVSVVTLGTLPVACQSGGVGDPCTPEDEYTPDFAGFKVQEENIESRSFQCATRICLVNHFQGRVSCPLGQPVRKSCSPGNTAACAAGEECVEASAFAFECDVNSKAANQCPTGTTCQKVDTTGLCRCDTVGIVGDPTTEGGQRFCGDDHVLRTYVCHKKNNCQVAGAADKDNAGKDCCVPGTDTPVSSPVCGQCSAQGNRNAQQAVYCSCRCGPAEGDEDPNFNFCTCPTGFECSEIRPNIGLGDPNITGKYCIRAQTAFKSGTECGSLGANGHYEQGICSGTPGAGTQ